MFALELSNILNLLTQDPNSGFEYYHYGYRFDSIKEIPNNFDRGNKVGRKYPAIQMDVPDSVTLSSDRSSGTVRIWFDDLLDYNNAGQTTSFTLLEVQERLFQKARVFLTSLDERFTNLADGAMTSPVTITPRSTLGSDRVVTLEATFSFMWALECVDDSDIIKIGGAIPDEDIERIG